MNLIVMGVRTLQPYNFLGKFSVNVAVVVIALNDGILEVEDGEIEIDHIP